MAAQNIPLTYKGHPLRRKDSLIYYGSMAQKYIIMLQILSQKKDQDLDVATKVTVQLQRTDPDLKSRDRVVKKSEKNSKRFVSQSIQISQCRLNRLDQLNKKVRQ